MACVRRSRRREGRNEEVLAVVSSPRCSSVDRAFIRTAVGLETSRLDLTKGVAGRSETEGGSLGWIGIGMERSPRYADFPNTRDGQLAFVRAGSEWELQMRSIQPPKKGVWYKSEKEMPPENLRVTFRSYAGYDYYEDRHCYEMWHGWNIDGEIHLAGRVNHGRQSKRIWAEWSVQ